MVGHDSTESQECLQESLINGFVSGLKASVCTGGLYYLAWNYSPLFRYNFPAQARTALAVMPVFYTAWLNVEHSMHDCMARHAPEFVLKTDD
mmetsp:Transcript_17043/g.42690  ORF Transcript_17043/g.42690 Transcript_17043/m.42690 type:complete len:92 (-) Transcript_17043:443-718(-)|eukprot:CAMPEP_0202866658 /NCGR_PEP_ID=MMETSP1391-20130828/8287_1 /ASSEMBLY_ACC=CAM_ASM_000867 /TAXON_ID=1034604 /ORGANISM="Chlamydomonas leiostraca, Strain SAG 11-49" /LENGTH=91 /DNA_ID=CAMNT_0049546629 /DNA_START=52 /DNA_END=327 /DNA_ORIENTATION=+